MAELPLHPPHKGTRMNWLDRIVNPTHPTPDQLRREQATEETRTAVDDFLKEMRESIKDLQKTADPDQLDYPIASSLRRKQDS